MQKNNEIFFCSTLFRLFNISLRFSWWSLFCSKTSGSWPSLPKRGVYNRKNSIKLCKYTSRLGKLGQLPDVLQPNGDNHENRKEIGNKRSGGNKKKFLIFFMHKVLTVFSEI